MKRFDAGRVGARVGVACPTRVALYDCEPKTVVPVAMVLGFDQWRPVPPGTLGAGRFFPSHLRPRRSGLRFRSRYDEHFDDPCQTDRIPGCFYGWRNLSQSRVAVNRSVTIERRSRAIVE